MRFPVFANTKIAQIPSSGDKRKAFTTRSVAPRMPKTMTSQTNAVSQDIAPPRQLSVAKRPLGHLTPESRANIAQLVLDRYMLGEQVADMAPEFGTSDVTLYALLLREHQDDWKEVQKARALARFERSQHQLKTASDGLSLARAREEVRSAQWELERLLRRLYGQEAPTTAAQVVVMIGSDLRALQQKHGNSTEDMQVIDVQPITSDMVSAAGVVEGVGEVRK